ALFAALLFTVLVSWRESRLLKIDLFVAVLASLALASDTALGRLMRLPFVTDRVNNDETSESAAQTQNSVSGPDRYVSLATLGLVHAFLIAVPLMFIAGLYFETKPVVPPWYENLGDLLPNIIGLSVFAWVAVVVWRTCRNFSGHRKIKPGLND